MIKGMIIKHISNQYMVQLEDGPAVDCVAMGKLRKSFSPLVGDEVLVEKINERYAIQKILPRKNQLVRPSIANVDQAVIVMSALDPNFSTTLVDRIIFLVVINGVKPVIVVTKLDLVPTDAALYAEIADYRNSGYQIIGTGVGYNNEAEIVEIFANKVSVLTGQSGAGKSSLLNRIDPSFKLQTQEISKALGRGKHTTRHTQLHRVGAGLVADTPGFSSLDFENIDVLKLAQSIPDFKPYLGGCRFNDCKHIDEPGCVVKEAVENHEISKIRYDDYVEVARISKMSKASLHRRLK